MNYTIDNMGIETYHGPGFSHQLPNGFPFWVFLQMITPHRVNEGKEMRLAEAPSLVLPQSAPASAHRHPSSHLLAAGGTAYLQ